MEIIKLLNLASFGRRVRFLRQNKNMTQLDLATRCGVTQQTIHQIETGKIKMSKPEVLKTLAEVLEVNPSWLAFAEEIHDFGPEEIQMIRAYQALSPDKQQAIRTLLELDAKTK